MRPGKLLLAGLLFQLAILASMIGLRLVPLLTGEPIALKVQPVDPRDIFRGDYVILGYTFSRLEEHLLDKGGVSIGGRDLEGQTVYVSLVKDEDGRHWRPSAYSLRRPEGVKYIKTTHMDWNSLVAGIESYYVPEGTGHHFEEAVRQGNLTAHIRLTSDGKACLESLEVSR